MSSYKNRYEYNYRIIERIIKEIENNHDLRFNQILYYLGIVNNEDSFYKEPSEVLKTIEEKDVVCDK